MTFIKGFIGLMDIYEVLKFFNYWCHKKSLNTKKEKKYVSQV
jgi:hypothetical protein